MNPESASFRQSWPHNLAYLFLTVLMGAIMFQWVIFEWNERATNHDLFWLYTGFLRLTAGRGMVESFYETNPPLSVFIYTPAFLLVKYGVLELWHATMLYTLMIVGLSVLATIAILRRISFLTKSHILLIATGFLLCETILTAPNFGQRDHLIAIAAVPLALLLLARSWNYNVSATIAMPLLVMGTLCLLLKPYYGLLPAALMFHRVVINRRISVIFDSDFLIMATVTGIYATTLLFVFPDYLTVILPDVITLYSGTDYSMHAIRVIFIAGLWAAVLGLSFDNTTERQNRKLIQFLLLLALLSFGIFYLMMKGFAYHLLPCMSFLIIATLLTMYHEIRKMIPHENLRIGVLKTSLALLISIFPHNYFPSPAVIRDQPITRILSDCGENCRFMMMGGTVRIVQMVSYYSGREHASRFPKFWFLEGLQKYKGADKEEKYKFYAGLVAADIDFYKPEIIFSCDNPVKYVPLFSQYETFRKSFIHYRREREFSYNHDIFHRREVSEKTAFVSCELYRRTK